MRTRTGTRGLEPASRPPLLLQDPLSLGLWLSYDDSASSPRTPSRRSGWETMR